MSPKRVKFKKNTHLRHRQVPVVLRETLRQPRAVDRVKLAEGALGPDNKTTEVTARRQLENVELVDLAERHAGNVAEGALDAVVVVVDDKWAKFLLVATVAALADAGAVSLRLVHFLNVRPDMQTTQQCNRLLRLCEALHLQNSHVYSHKLH